MSKEGHPDRDPAVAETRVEIEPASMRTSGRCDCCGKSRRTVWGYVYRDGGPRACYFVEWTLEHRDRSARFDVAIGRWYDGTTEDDREVVSLEYRLLDAGPSFHIVDAGGRPAAEVGRATRASEVSGTPLGEEVVAIAEAVLRADERVRDLAFEAGRDH